MLCLAAIARTICYLLPSQYTLQQESRDPFRTARYSPIQEPVTLSFSVVWELATVLAHGRRSTRGAL